MKSLCCFAADLNLRFVDFIIRSGRAVLYPIYIGTFTRRLPPTTSEIELKDRGLRRFQDLRQSIEFLTSRGDIDASKLGYFGASLGAASAPVMLYLEERFRTAVLFEGGLYPRAAGRPEVDNFNLCPASESRSSC